MPVDTSKITDKQLQDFAGEDDLNEVCYDIQSEIGQTDGGVAGMFFTSEKETLWETSNKNVRFQMLKEYLTLEKSYSKL